MIKRNKTSRTKMTFEPGHREVPIDRAQTVLEVALNNDVELGHACGGMGICTTCRVVLQSTPETLHERTPQEKEMAEAREFEPNERLSCQLTPCQGLVVRIPED